MRAAGKAVVGVGIGKLFEGASIIHVFRYLQFTFYIRLSDRPWDIYKTKMVNEATSKTLIYDGINIKIFNSRFGYKQIEILDAVYRIKGNDKPHFS